MELPSSIMESEDVRRIFDETNIIIAMSVSTLLWAKFRRENLMVQLRSSYSDS